MKNPDRENNYEKEPAVEPRAASSNVAPAAGRGGFAVPNRPSVSTGGDVPRDVSAGDIGPMLRKLFGIVRNRWWGGLMASAFVLAMAGYGVWRSRPMATAETTMIAQSRLKTILDPQAGSGPSSPLREENSLENHLTAMTSRAFRRHLAAGFNDAEMRQIETPLLKPGHIPSRKALPGILAGMIKVSREKGQEFFTITVKHPDHDVAVMVANRFTSAYLSYINDAFQSASKVALGAMKKQAADISAQISSMEKQRRDFRQKYLLSDGDGGQDLISDRLKQINLALSDARVKRAQLQVKVSQAKRDLAKTPTPYDNPVLADFANTQNLRTQLETLRAQKNVMAADYGPNHPKMQAIDRNIASVESAIKRNFQLAYQDLEGQLSLAKSSEQKLNAELGDGFDQSYQADRLQAKISTLDEKIAAKRSAQAQLLQKIAHTDITANLPSEALRVVDTAYLVHPVLSRKMMISAAGVAGAGLAFFLVPLFLYAIDPRMSAGMDVEAVTGKDVLGTVSRMRWMRNSKRPHVVRDGRQPLHVESFLTVASQLALRRPNQESRCLLVSSTIPREGKSTVTSNLAESFARIGLKTVLVDCDFRRPVQHGFQKRMPYGGLVCWAEAGFPDMTNLLSVGGPLGLHPLSGNLHLIPAGESASQPAAYLMSPKMGGFFELLRNHYDVVLIDTPPAGVFQDALVLAHQADETVLIVRDRMTKTVAIRRVIADFERTPAPVGGIVMNAITSPAVNPQLTYRYVDSKYGDYYASGSKRRGRRRKPVLPVGETISEAEA